MRIPRLFPTTHFELFTLLLQWKCKLIVWLFSESALEGTRAQQSFVKLTCSAMLPEAKLRVPASFFSQGANRQLYAAALCLPPRYVNIWRKKIVYETSLCGNLMEQYSHAVWPSVKITARLKCSKSSAKDLHRWTDGPKKGSVPVSNNRDLGID